MERIVAVFGVIALVMMGSSMGCGPCAKKSDGVTTEFCANSKACEHHGRCEARNGRCINPNEPVAQSKPEQSKIPPGPWTVHVKMNRSKPNGKSWDGGLARLKPPDIFIKVNGTSYESQKCPDTFKCSFVIQETGKLNIHVVDKDVGFDDSAGSTMCTFGERCTTGGGATVYVEK